MEQRQNNTLSKPILEALIARLYDAYQATEPGSRANLWQSLLAILDMVASGQFHGRMVLRVDFSLRATGTVTGTKVERLRFENMTLDLPLTYDHLVGDQPIKTASETPPGPPTPSFIS